MDDDEDLVKTKTPRAGPKKIDDWTVNLPGGERVRVSVYMEYTHGMANFTLSTEHEALNLRHLLSSDINDLRSKLNTYIRNFIRNDLSEGWVPGCLVELHHKVTRSEDGTNSRMSLTLDVSDVDRLAEQPTPSNLPIVTIRNRWKQRDVIIRAHEDDFSSLNPRSNSLQDPEVIAWLSSPLSSDGCTGTGRIFIEDKSSVTEIMNALERFNINLAHRLSPSEIDRKGMPLASDLVDLMEKATRDVSS